VGMKGIRKRSDLDMRGMGEIGDMGGMGGIGGGEK